MTRPVAARPGATWASRLRRRPRLLHARRPRRGDLIARLETDRALRVDPYDVYDELRAAARSCGAGRLRATAHHEAVTEMLRSDDFVVGAAAPSCPARCAGCTGRLADPWAPTGRTRRRCSPTDGPDHTRYRRLVSRAFTARAVSGLEDRIREHRRAAARRPRRRRRPTTRPRRALRRPAAGRGHRRHARRARAPMHGRLLRVGQRRGGHPRPGAVVARSSAAPRATCATCTAGSTSHVRALRAEPGDDLLSRLAVLEGDDALTDVELRATGLLVLGAGFETTVNLIGNAVAPARRAPRPARRCCATTRRCGAAPSTRCCATTRRCR